MINPACITDTRRGCLGINGQRRRVTVAFNRAHYCACAAADVFFSDHASLLTSTRDWWKISKRDILFFLYRLRQLLCVRERSLNTGGCEEIQL